MQVLCGIFYFLFCTRDARPPPQAIFFVKEAIEFSKAVQDKETRKNEQFRQFVSVVNKFIKTDAPFEVQTGSDAKAFILQFLDKTMFKEIDKAWLNI